MTRWTYWPRPRFWCGGDAKYRDGLELERIFPRPKARMTRWGPWMLGGRGGGGGRRRRRWGTEEDEEEVEAVEEVGPGGAAEGDEGR